MQIPLQLRAFPALCALALSVAVQTLGATSPCNVGGDANITVSDVQLEINEALGTASPANDLTGDGVVNVADVQIVLGVVLGYPCPVMTGPPSIAGFSPNSGP